MSQILETSIVVILALLLIFALLFWHFKFLVVVQSEGRHLKEICDEQIAAQTLYDIKHKPNVQHNFSENTAFLMSSAKKMLETVRLAQDLLNLEKYRQAVSYQSIDFPFMDTLYPLPALPDGSQQDLPALPAPSGNEQPWFAPAPDDNPWLLPEYATEGN